MYFLVLIGPLPKTDRERERERKPAI